MNRERDNNVKPPGAGEAAGGRILQIGFLLLIFMTPAVDWTLAAVKALKFPEKTFVEDFSEPYHPNRDLSYVRQGDLSSTFAAPELVRRYGKAHHYHIRTDARGFFTPPGSDMFKSGIVIVGDSFTLGPRTEETLAGLLQAAPGQPRGNVYNLGSPTNSVQSFLMLYPPLDKSSLRTTPRKLLILTLCKRNLTGNSINDQLSLYSPDSKEMKKKMLVYRVKKNLNSRFYERVRERSAIIGFSNSFVSSLRIPLGIFTQPQVTIIGAGGTLFYSYDAHFWKTPHGADDISALADGLSFLKREAEIRGYDLMLVMTPDKSDVYPEMLPEAHRTHGGDPVVSYFSKIEDILESRGISVVNLLPSFRAAAKQNRQLIYYPDDTHWNTLGKRIAVRSILSKLNKLQ